MSRVYDLEPRDPIVIGDGRSIGRTTMTASMDVPFPSTIAGLVRTTLGRDGRGQFQSSRVPELLAQMLTGPLLVNLDDNMPYAPAPADVVFFEGDDKGPPIRRRLSPHSLGEGELTDLDGELQLVGLSSSELRKPMSGPRYWSWTAYERWLLGADDDGPIDPKGLGLDRLVHEERVHVAVQPETSTVKDGALFRTDGVRYTAKLGGSMRRFALRFAWDGDDVPTGVASLGGERRLSVLGSSPKGPWPPPIPSGLIERIAQRRRARILLLTPAIFDRGFRPTAFTRATLVACAVGRAVVVSGWDHAVDPPHGRPKPTRRCAPPGSVYWVDLEPGVTDVRAWVEQHWFKNVSSAEQDRLDGFGLAVVGVG